MSVRAVLAVAVSALVLSSGCGYLDRGLDGPAGLDVARADRVEVRDVVAPGEEGEHARQLPTPFGRYAHPVGVVPAAEADALVRAVGAARYIDTGNVTYDLANPDREVVFLDGEEVLARLGYYAELGTWGEYEVPGRWIDADWRLLALTIDLPPDLR